MRAALILLACLAGLILVGWAAGEIWTALGAPGDLEAVRSLAVERSSAATSAMRLLTRLGSGTVLWPLAAAGALALAVAGLRRDAWILIVSLAGAVVLYDSVKVLVDRTRPPVHHLEALSSPSFPSGHSTQAAAFWLAAVLALRAAGLRGAWIALASVLAVLIALGVGFSRIYLGVHYPGDVIAGLTLGSAWALLCRRVLAPRPGDGGAMLPA